MGQILRVIAEEEQIKLAVITAPDMVEQARKIHSLSPTASAAPVRAITASTAASTVNVIFRFITGLASPSFTCRRAASTAFVKPSSGMPNASMKSSLRII